jgi:hypothetical protein
MSAVEIVILVVAVIAAGALLLSWGGSGLFSGGAVGTRSVRGRLRGRSEGDTIDRDHDPTRYAPRGGHHPDPPGMGKPPNEGGLL